MGAKKFFIIAGENSGDLHGSNLVRALRELDPDAQFFGLGGEQMKSVGVELLRNIVKDLAIIGFTEAIAKLPKIRRLRNETIAWLKRERPDGVILIDYPGFNFIIMKAAKELGIPVFYYICPQFWAWREHRKYELRDNTAKIIVVLPFEESALRETGADATYVGHPLLDIMNLTMTREEVFGHFGFDPKKRLIGIIPGSRKSEVDALLPVMLEAAERVSEAMPDVQFTLPRATTIRGDLIKSILARYNIPVKIVDEYRYNVRSCLDFAWVKSGTATLETALLGTPMLIVYKVSWLSWMLAKSIVKVPFISLVNLIANDLVVPELLQNEATAQNIAERTLRFYDRPEEQERMTYQLAKIREKMGGPGASARAAKIIHDYLQSHE
ncbi:MAG: lipid-A-disaccharide synthase [bacterium]